MRTFNIIWFVLLGFLYASCSRDSGVVVSEPQLKVVESQIIFETTGGTGYIKVMASEQVTAISNQNWCTVSLSGNTINLAVEANEGMGGRTAIIAIKSGAETTTVTAVQTGAFVWLKDFQNGQSLQFLSEGSTLKTAASSSFPITVEKPDWISYEFANDSLYLTAAAGSPASGTIVFTSGGLTKAYPVLRCSYAGLLGEWDMQFYNPGTGKTEHELVTLSRDVVNASVLMDGLVIAGPYLAQIKMGFNPTTFGLTLSAGQYLSTIEGQLIYISLRSAAGNVGGATTAQLAGKLAISPTGVTTYTFGDNGTWTGYVAGGFGFYLWSGTPPVTSGTSYRRFMDIVLTKL